MKSESFILTKNTFGEFIERLYPWFNMNNTEQLSRLYEEFESYISLPCAYYAAASSFRKFLREKYGNIRQNPRIYISYWKLMGYDNIDDIKKSIRKYISEHPHKGIEYIFVDDDKQIRDAIVKSLHEFNFSDSSLYDELKRFVFGDEVCVTYKDFFEMAKRFIIDVRGGVNSNLSEMYWESRGFCEDQYKSRITLTQRERSCRCIEHYLKKGYTEEDAKLALSKLQSSYSVKGKSHKEYWIDKGYCSDDAEMMAKEYARTISVRCDEYWRRRGYSDDEIERKKLEMNPSSVFFYDNVDEYISHFKKASEAVKKSWASKYMNYCISGIKEGKFKSVSKSEKMIFDFLISNVNKNIKHEPYIVLIPEDRRKDTVNSYFYVCDGYLNVNGGVILIEFDGVMYHNSEKDEQRDYDILSIDRSVLGIIHIKQETKLSNSWYKIKCLQINEAIQEITNTTKSRIYI